MYGGLHMAGKVDYLFLKLNLLQGKRRNIPLKRYADLFNTVLTPQIPDSLSNGPLVRLPLNGGFSLLPILANSHGLR
jgi:hypothetical protein